MHKVNIQKAKSSNKGYVFPTLDWSGPEQMAMDVMLLEKAIESLNFSLALRFYNWKGPWLSIGRNQKSLPKRWLELALQKKINLVKRPSGGNAVLHSGGLTYAFIWLFPPRKKHEAYYYANQWLIKGFSELGLSLQFGNQSANASEKNCFSTSTPADLIDQDGQKRIGSAQLWRRGHLLQHGEILLDPPAKLWMDIFKTKAPEPASMSIPRKGLDKILSKACKSYWSKIDWQSEGFAQKELQQITFEANKYSLQSIYLR